MSDHLTLDISRTSRSRLCISLYASLCASLCISLMLSVMGCEPQQKSTAVNVETTDPNQSVGGESPSSTQSQEGQENKPPVAIEESAYTLSFQRPLSEGTLRQVQLVYQRAEGEPRARAAELYLKVGPGLRYRSSEVSESLQSQGKELIVQTPTPELVRVIIFSRANLTPLANGSLLTLSFEEVGEGPEEVELSRDRPLFAPMEANESLRIQTGFNFEGELR